MVQDNEALGPDSENTWVVDDTDFAELLEKYGYWYEPGNIDELYKIIADEKGIRLEELKELLGECFGAVSN